MILSSDCYIFIFVMIDSLKKILYTLYKSYYQKRNKQKILYSIVIINKKIIKNK